MTDRLPFLSEFVEASLREIKNPDNNIGLDDIIEAVERELIIKGLKESEGNVSKAAHILRAKRSTLGDRIRKLLGFYILSSPQPDKTASAVLDAIVKDYHSELLKGLYINNFEISMGSLYDYSQMVAILKKSKTYLTLLKNQGLLYAEPSQDWKKRFSGYEVTRLHKKPDQKKLYTREQVAELFYTSPANVDKLISSRMLETNSVYPNFVTGRSIAEVFKLVHPMKGTERYSYVMNLVKG